MKAMLLILILLRTLKEYTHAKNAVWGVTARNREQNFSLNLLMDPECDFVTLTGTAGTGKTLMTLAAALSQVMDDRRYTEIIVTRVTVPVGEDIGYLPGNEEEKMNPWMGALDDNLEVLSRSARPNTGSGSTIFTSSPATTAPASTPCRSSSLPRKSGRVCRALKAVKAMSHGRYRRA